MALKLRRAEKRFIPQSTRAASFKRLLGSAPIEVGKSVGYHTDFAILEVPDEPIGYLSRVALGPSGLGELAQGEVEGLTEGQFGRRDVVGADPLTRPRSLEKVVEFLQVFASSATLLNDVPDWAIRLAKMQEIVKRCVFRITGCEH